MLHLATPFCTTAPDMLNVRGEMWVDSFQTHDLGPHLAALLPYVLHHKPRDAPLTIYFKPTITPRFPLLPLLPLQGDDLVIWFPKEPGGQHLSVSLISQHYACRFICIPNQSYWYFFFHIQVNGFSLPCWKWSFHLLVDFILLYILENFVSSIISSYLHLQTYLPYIFSYFHIKFSYFQGHLLSERKKNLLQPLTCAFSPIFLFYSLFIISSSLLHSTAPQKQLVIQNCLFRKVSILCLSILSLISLWLWLVPLPDYCQFFLLLLMWWDCTSLPP